RNINFSAVEMDTKIEENRCRISSSPNCSQKRITEVADLSSSANWPPKCKNAKSVMSKKFPLSALRSFPTQRVELEHAIDPYPRCTSPLTNLLFHPTLHPALFEMCPAHLVSLLLANIPEQILRTHLVHRFQFPVQTAKLSEFGQRRRWWAFRYRL